MILILGGAGYIGSHMVRHLIENNRQVIVVDNLQSGHVKSVHEKAIFIKADIRDRDTMRGIFESYDINSVIHFAANSLVGESMSDPLKYFDNNIVGTLYLLEIIQEFKIDKLIFSSSAAVYGEPIAIPIVENDRTLPTNPYGETKLTMEKMINWTSISHGLRYVSLRYFNVAGASSHGNIGEDHKKETHLIPLILQVPLGKKDSINIFGNDYNTPDGTCIRDYIHVEDLCDAHFKALEYLEKGGSSEIFNLGNGEGFSVLEVVNAARKVTGHLIPLKLTDRREGDPARLVASSEKAINYLGWKPNFTTIESIIESAWNWHKRNPSGFND